MVKKKQKKQKKDDSGQHLGISYGRFSDPKQKKGRSQQRQLRLAERYARRNRLLLDASLSAFDEGLSGYWGDHATMKGHLGKFLALCGTPRVPAGSVLIIEDFDRLSRQLPDDAWEMFRGILLTGVEIAVLSMSKRFTRESLNSFEDRIVVQAAQKRAHEESALKADRLKDVWRARRRRARKGHFKPTRMPKWVRKVRVDGKRRLELIPERAATLLEMVRLHEAGEGCSSIAVTLNGDTSGRFPCWMTKGNWANSDVHHLLTSVALWGGYQPGRREEGGRRFVPVGEPIADCYPAVIDRERAAAILARLSANSRKGGRKGEFNSMLRHIAHWAPTGGPLYAICPGAKPSGLVPVYLERNDQGGRRLVIDYYVVETAVLRILQHWTHDALRAADDGGAASKALRALEQELREIGERRDVMRARLRTARAATVADITDALDALAGEEEEAQARLNAAAGAQAPGASVLKEAQALAVEMEKAPAERKAEFRLRLNRRLRDLLEGVWIYRQDLGVRKAAVWVQVRPRAGAPVTQLLMLGKPPEGWDPPEMGGVDFRTGLRGK